MDRFRDTLLVCPEERTEVTLSCLLCNRTGLVPTSRQHRFILYLQREEETTIKVKIVALGSVADYELAPRATIADAQGEARVDATLECRYRGRSVPSDERSRVTLEEGDTLVFTAPSVKHG